MTDSAATIPPEAAEEEDLGDLLLEVLPGDGTSLGNLSAREALSQAAGAEVSEEAYEEVKERLLAMGLIRKGRGRGGGLALATDRPSAWETLLVNSGKQALSFLPSTRRQL